MPAIRIRLRAVHFGAMKIVRLLSALGETFFMLMGIIPYLWVGGNTKTPKIFYTDSEGIPEATRLADDGAK